MIRIHDDDSDPCLVLGYMKISKFIMIMINDNYLDSWDNHIDMSMNNINNTKENNKHITNINKDMMHTDTNSNNRLGCYQTLLGGIGSIFLRPK